MSAVRQKRPWSGLQAKWHPKQRIFLSIDVIDSTRLKTEVSTREWAESLLAFLPEAEVAYRHNFIKITKEHCRTDRCEKSCASEQNAVPRVWKYIGDEVVLVADLTCRDPQPYIHIMALAQTIKDFNSYFQSAPNIGCRLCFKGTAWVAAFPSTNIEIELPISMDSTPNVPMKDYLGPSMDLGFRLARFSTDDRLVVSASLAYLILKTTFSTTPIKIWDEEMYQLPLCFGGIVTIKGIKNERHPLIWYSVKETQESRLSCVDLHNLMKFLTNEYFGKDAIFPFIDDGSDYDPRYDGLYDIAVDEQKNMPHSVLSLSKNPPLTIMPMSEATPVTKQNIETLLAQY